MVKICSLVYPESNQEQYKQYYNIFKYDLHDFQKWSIEATVNGNHVLVCAPTGTGKSVCAEFAIDYFASKGRKVIYCSPIKSLSNQKYSDFTRKFPHVSVGLITGDISCNTHASVLIMTTEILLNKLYQVKNKSISTNACPTSTTTGPTSPGFTTSFDMDIENDLACVIFDEIHMIADKDRGHVWENSIMMLPPQVQIIGLSATLAEPEKFAEWIETKGLINGPVDKSIYLAKKLVRTVPLIHYGFVTVNAGLHKAIKDKALSEEIRTIIDKPHVIQSAEGVFNDENYNKINKVVKLLELKEIRVSRTNVLNQVSKFLVENEMLPALCYVFSRKQIEICVKEVTVPLLEFDSKIPYIVRNECEQIIRKLPNFQEYLQLPEYLNMVALLEKGIAYHHSGLLPVLREIVEMLFAKGYIKMLFCTESVAIGLNLPAKTAIFTDVFKHDGNHFRMLQGHEYVQAGGRSGRLGLDVVGHVVHLNNMFKNVDIVSYKHMMKGVPQKIFSQFKVSYNLIFNIISTNTSLCTLDCFSSYITKSMIKGEADSALSGINGQIGLLKEEINAITNSYKHLRTPVDAIGTYLSLCEQRPHAVNKKRKEIERTIQQLQDAHKFIDKDKAIVIKCDAKQRELNEIILTRDNTSQYIDNKIHDALDLLIKNGFINEMKEETLLINLAKDSYHLTAKGTYAVHLREVNCLVFAQLFADGVFDKLSALQCAMVFSCFTNVSVNDNDKSLTAKCCDDAVQSVVETIFSSLQFYLKEENDNNISTGINYDIHYDLLDYVSEWWECESEPECKLVIQKIAADKGVFLGEFVKALLKINNVSAELQAIAEQTGNMELLQKLQSIPLHTLKFVATNQSLYV